MRSEASKARPRARGAAKAKNVRRSPRAGPALRGCDIVSFVATKDPVRAKVFYRETLGLVLQAEDDFALVFDAHGIMLRVVSVQEVAAAQYTVLGWRVPDIAAAVDELRRAGVKFERYAGMGQDERGIWKSPAGGRIAWFKDPDGNTLSVTQF